MNEQDIYERVAALEQSAKSAHHRIDEIAEANKSISEILVEMRYMRRDLNKIIERVSAVEGRPVRRYDTAVNAVITAIIAAVISIVL